MAFPLAQPLARRHRFADDRGQGDRVMRLKMLLAGLLLLLPMPALADVTARYNAGPSNVTVEAADNGDWRITIGGPMEMVMLHHDGVDYIVMRDKDEVERVARADQAFPIMTAGTKMPGASDMVFKATPGAADALAGYSGTRWTYGPEGEPPIELLISPDPRLAPVGAALRGFAELIIDATGDLLGPDTLRQMLAGGTLLRLSAMDRDQQLKPVVTLDTVSMDAIAPARFALPGPVMPGADFVALVAPRTQPRTVTVEVPNPTPPPPTGPGIIID